MSRNYSHFFSFLMRPLCRRSWVWSKPYATEYMTKYMNLQNSKKHKEYREVQYNIYLDCMASGDVGEVTKWAGAAKDRQKPSWRKWQMFILELMKKQEARPSGQPHPESVLLTLPNGVFMMIFRFAFYGYAQFPEYMKRRCVELERRWDRGKVEWRYMCQVCPRCCGRWLPWYSSARQSSNTTPTIHGRRGLLGTHFFGDASTQTTSASYATSLSPSRTGIPYK